MERAAHTTRREQNRKQRWVGYAIGVAIESAGICFIMLVAFAISYLVAVWYR